MGNMRFKAGDRVKIKSLDWYNRYTNGTEVNCEYYFFTCDMKKYCGQIMTISVVRGESYEMIEDDEFAWTDELIEGLVEEETKPKFKKGDCVKCSDGSIGIIVTCDWSDSLNCYQYYIDYIGTLDAGYQSEKDLQPHMITTMNGRDIFEGAKWRHEFECPEGYQFVDENGNVINATKIVLEKKKKEYPKTYEECYKIMGVKLSDCYIQGYKSPLLEDLQELLICRDAYWKIAGEEMGLGKPWKPDFSSHEEKFSISVFDRRVVCIVNQYDNIILTFPTIEMRDAFYENFKELIEQCKELL